MLDEYPMLHVGNSTSAAKSPWHHIAKEKKTCPSWDSNPGPSEY